MKPSKNIWVPIRRCSCVSSIPKEMMVNLSHNTIIYQNLNKFDRQEKEPPVYFNNLKSTSINKKVGDGEKLVYENISDLTNGNIYPISILLVKNKGNINVSILLILRIFKVLRNPISSLKYDLNIQF